MTHSSTGFLLGGPGGLLERNNDLTGMPSGGDPSQCECCDQITCFQYQCGCYSADPASLEAQYCVGQWPRRLNNISFSVGGIPDQVEVYHRRTRRAYFRYPFTDPRWVCGCVSRFDEEINHFRITGLAALNGTYGSYWVGSEFGSSLYGGDGRLKIISACDPIIGTGFQIASSPGDLIGSCDPSGYQICDPGAWGCSALAVYAPAVPITGYYRKTGLRTVTHANSGPAVCGDVLINAGEEYGGLTGFAWLRATPVSLVNSVANIPGTLLHATVEGVLTDGAGHFFNITGLGISGGFPGCTPVQDFADPGFSWPNNTLNNANPVYPLQGIGSILELTSSFSPACPTGLHSGLTAISPAATCYDGPRYEHYCPVDMPAVNYSGYMGLAPDPCGTPDEEYEAYFTGFATTASVTVT